MVTPSSLPHDPRDTKINNYALHSQEFLVPEKQVHFCKHSLVTFCLTIQEGYPGRFSEISKCSTPLNTT